VVEVGIVAESLETVDALWNVALQEERLIEMKPTPIPLITY
jgi:hypothetical protein